MILKPDCRHFPGDRPCRFNKEYGQMCPDCPHYEKHGHRILVVKLAALGDVLRTTAILPGIKEQFPHSYIVWLTLNNARDLLKGNPLINEIWTLEGDAPARLAAEEFDLVFNPDADKLAAGLAQLASAKEKRGLVLDPSGFVKPATPEATEWLEMGAFDQLKKQNRKNYQQLIYEMLKLTYHGQEVIFAQKESERSWAEMFLHEQNWKAGEKLVGLNLGGGGRWKKKRWKQHHFQTLASALALEPGVKVLLIGGEHEKNLLAELKNALPSDVIVSGHNRTLRETAALIGCCKVLLTGDTLAFHFASALRVPTILLLGPTSASELELYGRGEKIVAPIGCVCCYLTDCDIDPDCMQLIAPAAVLAAIKKWL